MIYVISEKEGLTLLPSQAFRVLFSSDLGLIKKRFALRLNGNLPDPVEAMLERKHGMFSNIPHDMDVSADNASAEEISEKIMQRITSEQIAL